MYCDFVYISCLEEVNSETESREVVVGVGGLRGERGGTANGYRVFFSEW